MLSQNLFAAWVSLVVLSPGFHHRGSLKQEPFNCKRLLPLKPGSESCGLAFPKLLGYRVFAAYVNLLKNGCGPSVYTCLASCFNSRSPLVDTVIVISSSLWQMKVWLLLALVTALLFVGEYISVNI